MFHGERPHLASPKVRREIDTKSLFAKIYPEDYQEETDLIEKGFKWEDELFHSSRGLTLGTLTFVPPENNQTEVGIIFCHGYSNNLRWNNKKVFLEYAKRGILVTGMELEGHGISDGTLGLFKDMDKCVQDLHEFITQQQKKFKLKKWFIQGESMGGQVAIFETLKAQEAEEVQIDGMILIAPLVQMSKEFKPSRATVRLFAMLSKIVPSLSIIPNDIDDKMSFKRAEVITKIEKDPLKYLGKPRVATGYAVCCATGKAWNLLPQIRTPFMILHGKKDSVTDYRGSSDMLKATDLVLKKDKELFLSEEGMHSLFYGEPEADIKSYWEKVFEWLLSRV